MSSMPVYIKTPQLIGIICGVLVFLVTITAVILLLIKSGTFSRFVAEMKEGTSPPPVQTSLHSKQFPELYDHLLEARSTLPLVLIIPPLKGQRVSVKPLNASNFQRDIEKLIEVSDGRAIFGESAYDPSRIWGWFILQQEDKEEEESDFSLPDLSSLFSSSHSDTSMHHHLTPLMIIDNELDAPVGMLCLAHNQPAHLSIQLDLIWLTPAYQGKMFAHEAVYLLLQHLFRRNYRRIVCECDARNVIGRKFLERLGFTLEAVLRKHKIVRRRNRDTALYVMLNSDWEQVCELKLKKLLGISLKPVMQKAAEIEDPAYTTLIIETPPSSKLE